MKSKTGEFEMHGSTREREMFNDGKCRHVPKKKDANDLILNLN